MPNTFTKIASVSVGSGGASNISFTSIPSTYTDLCIKLSARSSAVSNQDRFVISFNGSAANYTLTSVNDAAGSAASYTRSAFGDNQLGYIPAASATANTFGNLEIYIPNYTSSNFKSISVDEVMENNSATNYNSLLAGLWSQTAAITSLTFTANIVQYSTATLYGIKNS